MKQEKMMELMQNKDIIEFMQLMMLKQVNDQKKKYFTEVQIFKSER